MSLLKDVDQDRFQDVFHEDDDECASHTGSDVSMVLQCKEGSSLYRLHYLYLKEVPDDEARPIRSDVDHNFDWEPDYGDDYYSDGNAKPMDEEEEVSIPIFNFASSTSQSGFAQVNAELWSIAQKHKVPRRYLDQIVKTLNAWIMSPSFGNSARFIIFYYL